MSSGKKQRGCRRNKVHSHVVPALPAPIAWRSCYSVWARTDTPGVNILRDVPTMGEPDHRTGEMEGAVPPEEQAERCGSQQDQDVQQMRPVQRDRLAAEIELKLSRDHLEELVQKRTADLAVARDAAIRARRS